MHGFLFWLILLARLHGHAIFGVGHVLDTGTGTTHLIPVFGECFFFFFRFSDTASNGFDVAPTASRGKKKKEKSQTSDLSPLPTAATLRRWPELDRADRWAAPLSFFFFCFFFFALSPRCLLLLLRLLLRFLSLFRSF